MACGKMGAGGRGGVVLIIVQGKMAKIILYHPHTKLSTVNNAQSIN